MRRLLTLSLGIALLAGCAWVPSGLQIGGTPLDRVERNEEKAEAAKDKLLKASQEAAHKTEAALSAAPASRPVEVARDFSAEAVAGLDQALGTPAVGDSAQWQDLVRRLLSEDEKIRAKAETERNADRAEIARLGNDLVKTTAAFERAEAKNREYERKIESLADIVRKVVWIGGGLVVLWVLGQVLSVAAKFNPALGAASTAVNSIVAPALTYSYNRAKTGLQRIGTAMTEVQKRLPDAVEQVREIFDKHADDDHKAVIGEACSNSGGTPS